MAQTPRQTGRGWGWVIPWIIAIVLVGAFVFFDVPDRIVAMYEQNQSQQGDAQQEDAQQETAAKEEEQVAGEDEIVETERPIRRARSGRNEENEILRSSGGEELQDGGTRYRMRITGIPQDTCLAEFGYTRMPGDVSEGEIATLTRRIEQNICRPQPGEEQLPLVGCEEWRGSRLCWRAVRKPEPAEAFDSLILPSPDAI